MLKKAYKGLEINQRVVDHPSQLPKEIVLSIRKKLLESKQGWSTKH
jgi:hypothetical protein